MFASYIKYFLLLHSVCACKTSAMEGEVDSSPAFLMVQLRALEVVEQVRHELAVESTLLPPCQSWCATNGQSWGSKCSWTTSCAGCPICDSTCASWCESNEEVWGTKCTWTECSPCDSCAPTPAPPTPSPTDTSGGFGDPHMVNILGEHFNIWRLGEVELLRIPRNSTSSTAALRFVADVSATGDGTDDCTRAPYMTSMRLGGSWFGTRELFAKMVDGEMQVLLGNMSVTPSSERVTVEQKVIVARPSEARVTVEVGNATIDLMHDAFFKQHFYLNMAARNLGSLGFEIGGVLGVDDHSFFARRPARCENEMVVAVAERHSAHLIASLD